MNCKPILSTQHDHLPVSVFESNEAMGLAAALDARGFLCQAIDAKGEANMILATGNSQLTFLHALSQLDGIDWPKVRIFHMDEYVGLDPNHPACFPFFLRKHLIDAIRPGAFYPIPGCASDVGKACGEYEALLRQYPADLVALGWGENGHLAFNDAPQALFFDPAWIKVVELAQTSRWQQVHEGHFKTIDEVPTHAITLTIPALLAARHVMGIVPEKRKAQIVRACLVEPVSEERPGSALRVIRHAHLYLDQESGSEMYHF